MPFRRNQSKIAQVRDEMSLDYASGRYLDIVSANLGLIRPPFGFDDDTWRAVVKLVALDYKQITNKFRDLLRALFGPQITQTAVLTRPAAVDDYVVFLNDTSKLPQLGTLILDQGIGVSYEEVEYKFIDRVNNAVFLRTPLHCPHAT